MSATPARLPSSLGLTNGDVPGGVVTAAQLAPCVDALRNGEGGQIVSDRTSSSSSLGRGLGAFLVCDQADRLGLQTREFVAPARGRRGQVSERRELSLRLAQRRQMR